MRHSCGLLELQVNPVHGAGCSRRSRGVHTGRAAVVVAAVIEAWSGYKVGTEYQLLVLKEVSRWVGSGFATAAMKAGNCGSGQESTLAVQVLEHPCWMEAAHEMASRDGHEVRTVPGLLVPQSAAAGSEGLCAAVAATVSEGVLVVPD